MATWALRKMLLYNPWIKKENKNQVIKVQKVMREGSLSRHTGKEKATGRHRWCLPNYEDEEYGNEVPVSPELQQRKIRQAVRAA